VLAGHTLVWSLPRVDGGYDVVAATESSTRSVVERLPAEQPQLRAEAPSIAASPERIALAYDKRTNGGRGTGEDIFRDAYTGPRQGPLEQLGGRCSLGSPDLPRPVDVSLDVVAYDPCDGSPGILVRDFGSPQPPERVTEGRARGLRIAGRWLAWIESSSGWLSGGVPGDIVVYDRASRAVAYTVPAAALGQLHALDLQEDGTVAFSFDPPGRASQVGWASPEAPVVHRVEVGGTADEVHIAAGRIAFLRGRAIDFDASPADVGVVDLNGTVKIVASGAYDLLASDQLDFDGQRVAWYELGCSDARIFVRAIGAAPLGARPRRGCPLKLRRRPVATRSGKFRLSLDCFGFANEICSGRDVRARRRGVLVASGARSSRVRLTSDGLHTLRARGRLPVRLETVVTDEAGRHERRRAIVVLKRAR
jgi:hypothetical protein